jgi:hypothetical protein
MGWNQAIEMWLEDVSIFNKNEEYVLQVRYVYPMSV